MAPSPALPGIDLYRVRSSGALPQRRAFGAFCIGVVIDGELDEYYQRAVHRIAPGTAYCVNPDEVFGPVQLHSKSFEAIGLVIDPPVLRAAAQSRGATDGDLRFRRFALDSNHAPAVSRIAQAIAARAPDGEQPKMLEECFAAILPAELSREPSTEPKKPARESILRIKDHLRERFAQKVLLEDLERISGLSRFHLVRRFTAEVGVPPHTYQVLVRVERAREQIRRGVSPVAVAGAVGFADQSHLTRHFKRRMGMTPGAYARAVAEARVRI